MGELLAVSTVIVFISRNCVIYPGDGAISVIDRCKSKTDQKERTACSETALTKSNMPQMYISTPDSKSISNDPAFDFWTKRNCVHQGTNSDAEDGADRKDAISRCGCAPELGFCVDPLK